jgi:hypothetical protein
MLMSEMRFNVTVSEKVGKLFRMKVVEVKGNKKGALSEAVEEAMIIWLEKHGINICQSIYFIYIILLQK